MGNGPKRVKAPGAGSALGRLYKRITQPSRNAGGKAARSILNIGKTELGLTRGGGPKAKTVKPKRKLKKNEIKIGK